MKNIGVKIFLVVVILYFAIMGIKSTDKEKANNKKILDKFTIVENGVIKPENNGKLVLVNGLITFDGSISFMELDYNFNSFKVERKVEDYVKKTGENGNVSYKWVLREKEIENNDDYLYKLLPTTKTLDTKIGDFKLDSVGLSKIKPSKLLSDKSIKIGDLEFTGLYYSLKDHFENEQVDDMRITYHYYEIPKDGYLTVLAEQKDDSFVPYKLDSKTNIYKVYNGKVNSKKLLEEELNKEVKSNIKGKILFIGIILIIGGFLFFSSKKKEEPKNI